MTRFRRKAWCATVVVAAALSCRFRYEQLDVTSSGVGGVSSMAGDASSGAISSGGLSDTLGGAPASVGGGANGAGEGGDGAIAVGGMDGTAGGTESGTGGTSTGGSGTSGSSTGGNSGSSTGGTGGGPGVCVPDATCSCEVFQGHDYRFCAVIASRDTGLVACQAANMVLARADSAEENAWLLQQFTNHGMFIGAGGPIVILDGNDIQVEGQWRWEDGTLFWDGAVVGNVYTNWGVLPKGINADCLGMLSSGLWADRPCTSGNATVACESP